MGADAVEVRGKPSRARRTMHILGALLVAVVLPAVVIGVLVGEFGATAMFTGVLLGGVGAKLGGTRRMGYLAPLMGLAAGLGAFSAYDWWWAALLAIVGVIAGAGIGFGWFAPLLMVPYAATFVVPEASARNATVYGLIVGIATLYGVVLARRFGVPEVVDGERLSAPVAAVVALGFGAVMAASASLGVALGWTEPYWVPEPVLILVLYILMGKRDRIRGKAVGTALGVVAVIPVALGVASRMGADGARRRRVPRRVDADKDLLAHVRPVHVRARAAARRTGWGWLRGRGTRLPNPGRHRPARPRSGRRPRAR